MQYDLATTYIVVHGPMHALYLFIAVEKSSHREMTVLQHKEKLTKLVYKPNAYVPVQIKS